MNKERTIKRTPASQGEEVVRKVRIPGHQRERRYGIKQKV